MRKTSTRRFEKSEPNVSEPPPTESAMERKAAHETVVYFEGTETNPNGMTEKQWVKMGSKKKHRDG